MEKQKTKNNEKNTKKKNRQNIPNVDYCYEPPIYYNYNFLMQEKVHWQRENDLFLMLLKSEVN